MNHFYSNVWPSFLFFFLFINSLLLCLICRNLFILKNDSNAYVCLYTKNWTNDSWLSYWSCCANSICISHWKVYNMIYLYQMNNAEDVFWKKIDSNRRSFDNNALHSPTLNGFNWISGNNSDEKEWMIVTTYRFLSLSC